MTSYAPDLMFEHMLTPLKGWVKSNQLDYSAPISSNVTFALPAGRVVHLNSSGEFETGVSGAQMGIFLTSGANSPAVANPGTTSGGSFVHQAVMPGSTNITAGLVATGGYELATTEFVDATYAPNATLQATVANTTESTGGKLTAGTRYTHAICGVVSRGKYTNEHGVSVLAFWPVYLPTTP